MSWSERGSRGAESAPTDRALMESFLATQDDGAFRTLVHRHGPMVLAACRRVLGSHHDAEDAFQATFLVLARRAADVRPPELVGNWLHGVAYRTALKLRAGIARRRTLEAGVIRPLHSVETPQELPEDLRHILDEELNRLPDMYRSPLVLCDLEGRTYREAARELGVADGTLSNRLATARRLLARHLTQRGVTISATGLGLLLSGSAARAAARDAGASAAIWSGGAASGNALILAEGIMKTMMTTSSKAAIVVVAALLTLATAVGGVLLLAAENQDPDVAKMQGSWAVVGAERSGKKVDAAELGKMRVTIEKGKLIIDTGKRKEEVAFRLDSTTNPKSIDLKPTRGGETEMGIYTLDGNRLEIAWGAAKPGERQKEFATTETGGGRRLILERAKKE